ncbi:hypothetical protein OSB04_010945 [Centaurea solstitialis]|uniref:F-box domain-containing protein n=1 Tax=Centaurea solstitialis TaxID=347529 RepID=A0AA38TJ84_9ASTR|nr:hypothetical protein OSB04_010945 [Centaurea solstitialis]
MDSLADDVIQHIFSNLSNVKDLAHCLCVSKNFKRNITHHKTLCFPRGIFDNLKHPQTPDRIVTQMVSSIPRLEELVVCCPFTSPALASWLLIVGSSLKNLELFVAYDHNNKFPNYNLDCIQGASRNLESLRLWRVTIAPTPKWEVFQKLRNLEINEAKLENSILTEALRVTPNLTRLVLRSCKETCQGLDFGNLMALESLNVRGGRWGGDLIRKMLRLASDLKHLHLHFGLVRSSPFPDFVELFGTLPKLESFSVSRDTLFFICNLNNPKNVSFIITCY